MLAVLPEDRLPLGRTAFFGAQHLLALTGIFIFPVLIGSALELEVAQVGQIVQACFLLTGVVTVLQSSRLLRLPIVQGPTAAFFLAIVSAGTAYGLGTAFGSMVVAGLVFMALSIPVGRLGLMGHVSAVASHPVVFGSLFVIIGAQLAAIGLPGWFGTAGTPSFGAPSFAVAAVTALVVVACLVLGRQGLAKRGAVVWGIAAGTATAGLLGVWSASLPTELVGLPELLPFGFGVAWPAVLLMLLAFLQAGTESMGMYSLVGGWAGQRVDRQRVNRGLFTEFAGTAVGALFGGIGTTSYPENAGIVRVTGVGSRYVTMAAGVFAVALAFVPAVGLFVAGLPGPVLAAASTILFGSIVVGGIQMLSGVEWDDINLAVVGPSVVVALGAQFLPADVMATAPETVSGLVSSPMMVGVVLLLVLHVLLNVLARPRLERSRERRAGRVSPAPATTEGWPVATPLHHRVYDEARPLAVDGAYADWLDPATTVVVSVDMHDGHLSEDPDCPCPAPRGREVVGPVDAFHRAARAAGVPVVHVRSEVRASGVDDVRGIPSAWRTTFPQWVGPIPGVADHALAGSRWTRFTTEVEPEDEVVTGKKRLSAFSPTDLDFLLRQMGARTVVLDGIMADCCILSTAFDANNLSYRVVVLEDLVRGTDERLEAAALAMVSLHLGLVTSSSDLLGAWESVAARRRPVATAR
ncbi:hypothetical protein GCM10009756_03700 [Pseudokineococcus marinus]